MDSRLSGADVAKGVGARYWCLMEMHKLSRLVKRLKGPRYLESTRDLYLLRDATKYRPSLISNRRRSKSNIGPFLSRYLVGSR